MIPKNGGVSAKKTFSLYKGKISLIFNSNGHRYTVNNKDVIGVTTILSTLAKPALIPWAVNQTIEYLQSNIKTGKKYDEMEINELLKEAKMAYRKKKEKAADLGTLVHSWIESYIKGENPKFPENEEMKKAVNAFLLWVKEKKVKFLHSERPVYSRKYNYCGTCDFTCEIEGKKYVGDIKTSNAIYAEYMLQVAAYRYAIQEEDGGKYDGMIIVRVPKTAEDIEVFEFGDYETHAKTFLYTLKVWQHLQIIKNIQFKK